MPNVSWNCRPWYAGDGSATTGKRPFDQLNSPESTTTPPMLVPWPPMNFVAECTTMSAPHSIGRQRYGVAKVLSTISGSSRSCAIAATVSMSSTLPPGLPIVSPKKALVLSRTAAFHASGIVGIHPRQVHVHLAQHVLELIDGAAVERGRGDDVIAGLQQGEQRGGLRRDPARERDRAAAALEARHALLEHGDRRVHDPRVGVAVLLQVEVRRRRFRVFEHVARRLEDRHGARAGVRVGALACVHLTGVESEVARFFHVQWQRPFFLAAPGAVACAGSLNHRRLRASSNRKQSCPYGASITCSSTSLPAREAPRRAPRTPTADRASPS